jgi:hypothetical protein
MYTQVWTKFLPVIRIMLKRAVGSPQLLKLNRTDFDKAGGGKKVGFRFTVEFKNGKVQNRFTSAIAKDLVTSLQQDDAAMKILSEREFELELNTKCELAIRCISAGNNTEITTAEDQQEETTPAQPVADEA